MSKARRAKANECQHCHVTVQRVDFVSVAFPGIYKDLEGRFCSNCQDTLVLILKGFFHVPLESVSIRVARYQELGNKDNEAPT